jgi:UDP-galactopyranose mutase
MMQPGTFEHIKGTLITREITYTPDNMEDYEYPFPDKFNRDLYIKYRQLADKENNLLICGRLGEYKYYDMDQAIGRAMHLYKSL